MKKLILVTDHLNVWVFGTYGLGIYYTPYWSIYIVVGFIAINIFLDGRGKG